MNGGNHNTDKGMHGKVLHATVNDKRYQITSQGSKKVTSFQCQQEELDGRLLLHAAHAAREGYQAVVICSEDTDVFVMLLAYCDKIGVSLFQKCGTRTRTRLVDIVKVAASVGVDICRPLIGMHAYTGCDTVSALAGNGKASALKLLTINRDIQDTFLQLGQMWNLSRELMDTLEAFTCRLFARKSSSTKVNDLRYDIFCAKRG